MRGVVAVAVGADAVADAVRLYEKLGFVIRLELNAYYRDGESAYLMAIEVD